MIFQLVCSTNCAWNDKQPVNCDICCIPNWPQWYILSATRVLALWSCMNPDRAPQSAHVHQRGWRYLVRTWYEVLRSDIYVGSSRVDMSSASSSLHLVNSEWGGTKLDPLYSLHRLINDNSKNVVIDNSPTWKLFISLHPSDGGSRLTAHGGAGHLRLVAFSQDLIPGLDDGVPWRNWGRTNKQNDVNREGDAWPPVKPSGGISIRY